MTLNSKHRTEKLKAKNQKYGNTKNENIEKRKPGFTKRRGTKCRLMLTSTEQNNDPTRIMHKVQFRSSFNDMYSIYLVSFFDI